MNFDEWVSEMFEQLSAVVHEPRGIAHSDVHFLIVQQCTALNSSLTIYALNWNMGHSEKNKESIEP